MRVFRFFPAAELPLALAPGAIRSADVKMGKAKPIHFCSRFDSICTGFVRFCSAFDRFCSLLYRAHLYYNIAPSTLQIRGSRDRGCHGCAVCSRACCGRRHGCWTAQPWHPKPAYRQAGRRLDSPPPPAGKRGSPFECGSALRSPPLLRRATEGCVVDGHGKAPHACPPGLRAGKDARGAEDSTYDCGPAFWQARESRAPAEK
jgi:hypothetical protein